MCFRTLFSSTWTLETTTTALQDYGRKDVIGGGSLSQEEKRTTSSNQPPSGQTSFPSKRVLEYLVLFFVKASVRCTVSITDTLSMSISCGKICDMRTSTVVQAWESQPRTIFFDDFHHSPGLNGVRMGSLSPRL